MTRILVTDPSEPHATFDPILATTPPPGAPGTAVRCPHRRALAAGSSVAALLAVSLLGGCEDTSSQSSAQGSAGSAIAQALAAACDQRAADPQDPKRQADGVADGSIATEQAIETCANALLAQPDNPRLHYQQGRALRAAGRQAEAFGAFRQAADLGHAAAMKALGDAYLTGEGLPAGETRDAHQALDRYEKAAAGGYPPAIRAAEQTRAQLYPPPGGSGPPAGQPAGSAGSAPPAPAAPVAPDAVAEAIELCDRRTSDPQDPARMEKGVEDGDIALGKALQACTEAIRLEPQNPRLQYQLGRVLRLANRHDEAFRAFLEAADSGYAPALKGIGDSYKYGQGLPAGEPQSIEAALEWYERSWHAGYAPAEEAAILARDYLRQNTFSSAGFQNGEFVRRLYDGNFPDLDQDLAFAVYAARMFQELDSEQVVDHDPSCKPLLHLEGQLTIGGAAITGILVELQRAVNGANPAETLQRGMAIVTAQKQGEQDTYLIIKPKGWGCDSQVGRTILGHLGDLMPLIAKHLQALTE